MDTTTLSADEIYDLAFDPRTDRTVLARWAKSPPSQVDENSLRWRIASNANTPIKNLIELAFYGHLRAILWNPSMQMEALTRPDCASEIGKQLHELSERSHDRNREYPDEPCREYHWWKQIERELETMELPIWAFGLAITPNEPEKSRNIYGILLHPLLKNPTFRFDVLQSIWGNDKTLASLLHNYQLLRDHSPIWNCPSVPSRFWRKVLCQNLTFGTGTAPMLSHRSLCDRLPAKELEKMNPGLITAEEIPHAASPISWIQLVTKEPRLLDYLEPKSRVQIEETLLLVWQAKSKNPNWKLPEYLLERGQDPQTTIRIREWIEAEARVWDYHGWTVADIIDWLQTNGPAGMEACLLPSLVVAIEKFTNQNHLTTIEAELFSNTDIILNLLQEQGTSSEKLDFARPWVEHARLKRALKRRLHIPTTDLPSVFTKILTTDVPLKPKHCGIELGFRHPAHNLGPERTSFRPVFFAGLWKLLAKYPDSGEDQKSLRNAVFDYWEKTQKDDRL